MPLSNAADLNSFLADKSYIEGFTASQADIVILESYKATPIATSYPHAARWYSHISSIPTKSTLPGQKKDISSYGPAHATPSAAHATPSAAPADENEIDLFASSDEEEDAEAEKLKAERLAEYHKKKSAKPATIAKSMVILDVKPWDDETDMAALEVGVRAIVMDGLLWGTSKLVAVGYGIKKLQITCVIEDVKVGTDDLSDEICAIEDYVQSVDISILILNHAILLGSFNKI